MLNENESSKLYALSRARSYYEGVLLISQLNIKYTKFMKAHLEEGTGKHPDNFIWNKRYLKLDSFFLPVKWFKTVVLFHTTKKEV